MTGPMHRPEFREQGMTFRDYVRDVLGNDELEDAECDSILWELTPFPVVQGRDDLRPYLEAVRDGELTYEIAYAALYAQMATDAELEEDHPRLRGLGVITVQPTGSVL